MINIQTNAPTSFINLMSKIFYQHWDEFVLVFVNDILIYSNSEQFHKERLKLALKY